MCKRLMKRWNGLGICVMVAEMLAFGIASVRVLCGLFVRFLQKVANLWYDCGDFDLRNRVF
ncbi:hypothetical protein HW260_00995 [Helicobacter cinaedi]|uniref:Transmembrane protein n=1 Tax=Helicobacter cinaedi CCUG 18818 = ATCC BAA-847 TaxID=537971 RepID=A0ABN0B8C3_9HELI|nr:hypothetical protein [Helicobacter cinaedi]EFR45743.1 hypothetical protein HCCG_00289 [Helicobacter cinaedi CCUG 18818 = ATCC BAA-847]QOQ90974.1 hypothetical protein HW260_00995 [Helicobacter cinaedi]